MDFNKIINIVNNESTFSVETSQYLENKLKKLGYHISDVFDYTAELTICIGGDGSFLRALHQYDFPDIPIVGINTGHLGFLAEINPDEIDNFLDRYIKEDYFIHNINPIEAVICTRTDCINAFGLNEIVIKGDKSRTVHLDISVDDQLIQRFSGDGILVSTSTGSTAYNYSIGGSIVDPRLNVLQVTPLAPINTNAYRSFTSSVILPHEATIKVNPEYRFEDAIVLVSDGMEHRYNSITEISLNLSELNVRMLRLKGFEFWGKVIDKFL
ncbi:NAD(+)/NADH kinase [Alkaliphilus peptidifermentans]|uniref:NAD kinase n=1 Tax=Alkaliphilus peptidifermentans DSM 18978 TaxID=1120976 RepID=A0A1G5CLZ2_9FIRM|nr:NAD(+)/NADH kinase [Alkaliphilus peptidifermentans]SCY03432.1 NAD+ kinase [Alkaliphilus peptidifermentans DSM 18978]